MKDQTYWAVFTPEGEIVIRTISRAYETARSEFANPMQWAQDLDKGYTVSKIKITKIEE